jgi:hypothetical protein
MEQGSQARNGGGHSRGDDAFGKHQIAARDDAALKLLGEA